MMKTKSANLKFIVWLIILIVLCILFQLNLNRLGWNWQYGGDTESYKNAADEIFKGNFYHHKRLPVYPIFLLTSKIWGEPFTLLLQNFLNFLCPIFMYMIIFHLFKRPFISFFFSFLSFMYYDNTIYTNYMLTEVFSRFLVIAWVSCFFLSFKHKYLILYFTSFLLSGLKSQFFYVFVLVYSISALFKLISLKKIILLLIITSIIPIIYSFKAKIKNTSNLHNNKTIEILCRKQLFRHDHLWELELYPKSDKNIEIIKNLVNKFKDSQMNNFYFYDFYLTKFSEETKINENEASSLLKNLYIKVFINSWIYKPHYHIKSIMNDLYLSLDGLDTPKIESIPQKLRRYLRHFIEVFYGSLFVISFFSAILIPFIKNKKLNSEMLIFPIFLLAYIFIIYFIERQGGRHRIPINDSMIIMTLFMFKIFINKFKGDSNINAAS